MSLRQVFIRINYRKWRRKIKENARSEDDEASADMKKRDKGASIFEKVMLW